ncbi:hypothetical protein MHYP_G00161130 [Metynnis hypsauchen]
MRGFSFQQFIANFAIVEKSEKGTRLPELGGGLSEREECVCACTGGLQLMPPLIFLCAMIRFASRPHRSVCHLSIWGNELGNFCHFFFSGRISANNST